MKALILVLVLLSSPKAQAGSNDGLHVGATMAISGLTCLAFKGKSNRPIAFAVGFATAMFAGHLKESQDPYYTNRDMQLNAVGAVLGSTLCVSF